MTSQKKRGSPQSWNHVEIQEFYRAAFREGVVPYFEVPSDIAPTSPLLHKNSRFLYVLSGKGGIKIYDRKYAMEPGPLSLCFPEKFPKSWKFWSRCALAFLFIPQSAPPADPSRPEPHLLCQRSFIVALYL